MLFSPDLPNILPNFLTKLLEYNTFIYKRTNFPKFQNTKLQDLKMIFSL